MNDNTFWISVWGLVATVFITIILSITITVIDTNKKKLSAIKNGANPIEAKCAFDTPYGEGILICANFIKGNDND